MFFGSKKAKCTITVRTVTFGSHNKYCLVSPMVVFGYTAAISNQCFIFLAVSASVMSVNIIPLILKEPLNTKVTLAKQAQFLKGMFDL